MRKKTVILGFLLALSLILSYIESLLPLAVGIPGLKLGLSNLVVVILLYLYGGREALAVNLLRIVLSGFLLEICPQSFMRCRVQYSVSLSCF